MMSVGQFVIILCEMVPCLNLIVCICLFGLLFGPQGDTVLMVWTFSEKNFLVFVPIEGSRTARIVSGIFWDRGTTVSSYCLFSRVCLLVKNDHISRLVLNELQLSVALIPSLRHVLSNAIHRS